MFDLRSNRKDVIELFHNTNLLKVCAPMVRYSKLQFRNLVKTYNCDLFYTPMILADSFCKSEKARQNEFTTNLDDTPVIIQFAANNVDDYVNAAYLASPFCSGVDLNCGCPQRWARQQGLGCALLDHPEKIFNITRECRNRVNNPFTVSVKSRIFIDLRKTVEICKQIEKAGASFLTIHARTSDQSNSQINEEALKLIKENISIPLVANGGLKSLEDCEKLQKSVGCDGVMIANGILQNPAVFTGVKETPLECIQKWVDICFNSTITPEEYKIFSNTNEFKTIAKCPQNLTFQCFHHHLVFMMEKLIPKYKRRIFNNLKQFNEILNFLKEEFNIVPNLYEWEKLQNIIPLKLTYESEESENCELYEEENIYDIEANDGKYFKTKAITENEYKNEDWFDIFLENG